MVLELIYSEVGHVGISNKTGHIILTPNEVKTVVAYLKRKQVIA